MKRKRIKFIAYLLSLSMSLTGCNALNKDNISNGQIIESLLESSEESLESEPIEIIEEVEETPIPLNPLISEYMAYYDFETPYYINGYMVSPLKTDYYKSECTYSELLTSYEIANRIKENSASIPMSHSNFFECNKNVDMIASIIDEIKENNTNNVNEDIHTILSIKIYYKDYYDLSSFKIEDTTLAYYDEDTNILIVNKYNILTMSDLEGKTYDEVLKQILAHEFNHIRQDKCSCRIFDLNDLEYSDNSMTFIKESSAESELYNIKDSYTEYGIYQYERELETEILLLSILSDSEIDEYYNAIFDTDLKALHEFFSLKSEEDINDFNQIIYQMDALLYRNSYNTLENTYIDTADYELSIGYNYKIEIFKRCILNLLTKTNNKNISLEENLTIFNIIKNILIKNAFTYREEDDHFIRVTDSNFIESFKELEEKYIEFLSVYYDTEIEEIRSLEEVEIKCIIVNINNIIDGKDVINYKDEEAFEILNKYPLINNILNTTDIYQSNYETYLEDFNYTLTK